MNDEQYILIGKVLADEASALEKEELKKWLNASRQNRAEFERLSKTWQNIKTPQPRSVPKFTDIWQELSVKIDNESPQRVFPFEQSGFRNRYLAVAATILIILGGLFIFRYENNSGQIIRTAISEKKTITLPDGSVVQMNNESEIQYPEDYNVEGRNILLKGQAFFKVKKNGKPFTVQTQNARVQVLGTSFDVNTRNARTKVIVEEGHVLLSSMHSGKQVELYKDEMAQILDQGEITEVSRVDANHLLGWLNDILVFDKTPLIEIVHELEGYYGIKIKIEGNIKNLELTGQFSNQSAEKVVDLVCLALNLNYKYDKDVIVISR